MRLIESVTIAALIAGLASWAHADTYRDMEHVCPLDGSKFKARTVMSASSWGRRVDGKIIGATPQPWPHPVCPASGFMIYKEKFTDAELAAARLLVETEEYKRLRSTETPHYLAAYAAEKLGADVDDVWWMYLQASWGVESDRALNKRYVSAALERLDRQIAATPPDPTAIPWLHSLVVRVELLRRVERYDDASAAASAIPVAAIEQHEGLARLITEQRKRIAEKDWSPM